ncbi:ankyrin repeat domain-containing protein, chloroplastic isoform X1 [Cryptomeria japonica]|uniref:ankyrin repeat domain-containing protein, chloroplastic isoform X1 n=1 Tax=Cryptomeria japonica TaxID=3369 RepID=UPI0027DA29A6|nr:ankyrin repeat domain-containing protein, chloroplastic isoform X1 [Cryptomeria japonica]
MITHKAASIFTPHNFSPNSLPHCLQYKLHKFQLSLPFRLRKSLQLRTFFSHQNWTDYGQDDNILGDCVVFEEGIFEQPQIISKQTKNISKEDEEEEEESLIPEEWRELQTELNVPKRERKKRMQSIESANSFRRNREFELSRDGLSENNTIKLPELNFTQTIKISDNQATEISSAEAGGSDNISVTEELTGISSVKDDSDESRCIEEENVQALRSFSVGERGISSSQTSQIYSSSVRERNGQISCAEGESGKPPENFFVSDGILSPSQVTEVSSSVSEGNDEIHWGNGVDKVKISSESSVNARVFPKNPRLQVVGAGFEEISKRLDEKYKVEDDEENQPQERRQLFTQEEKVLLNKRTPDLQRATSAKWIPVHTFATAGQSYLLDFLLMHGVNVNVIDKDGQTALHKAITCKKEGIVNYLLKAGANALVRDRDGATLIHYAVEVAAIQIIKHLILYKVDIDAPDNYGWTPLHLAVQSRRTDVVRLLLIKGANNNIRNKDGNTPLDLCLHSGQDMRTFELIRLLKTLPKKSETLPNSIPSQILR